MDLPVQYVNNEDPLEVEEAFMLANVPL